MREDEISRHDSPTQSRFPRKLWQWFNRWRKRYLWARLCFLVLFGAHILNEAFFPLLPKLTRMAIDALDAASEPKLVNALARHRRIRVAEQLQVSLYCAADRNGDGVLDEAEQTRLEEWGLNATELEKKSARADLTQLIEASHRAGLLPKSFTARDVRRDGRFAAVAEFEQIKKPYRIEISAMLKAWQLPDYRRWETWERGINRFYEQLLMFSYVLGKPQTLFVWFSVCFFVPLMLTACLRKGKYAIGLLVGTAFGIAAAYGTCFYIVLSPFFKRVFAGSVPYVLSFLLPAVAFVALTAAFAGSAGRMSSGRRRPGLYSSVGAAGLGAVLLFWSLPRWVTGEASRTASEEAHWIWAFMAGGERLLYDTVPDWVRDGPMIPGAIFLIVGAWGMLLPLWKRKKGRKGEGA